MSDLHRAVSRAKQGGTFRLNITQVVGGALAIHAVALVAIALPDSVPQFLTVPVVVFDIVLIPGLLALLAARGGFELDARWVVYAFGTSLLLLLAHGVVINLLLPLFGVLRPMTTLPLAVGVTTMVFMLAGVVFSMRTGGTVSVTVPRLSPTPLALLVLPLWSILAVWVLNVSNQNTPIIVVLTLISFVPLVLAALVDEQWHALGVWMMSLAVIYHKALARVYNFSGSPDMVFNYRLGRWSPGLAANTPVGSELLPNGVLYPSIAHLTELGILTQAEVVNPLFVVSIPVAVFLTARYYVDSNRALLAAAIVVFAHPFYLQYPAGGRAATPVIFLSLFALVLTDSELPPNLQGILGLGFASGVVVSHYGTSYVILFTLSGALLLLYSYALFDGLVGRSNAVEWGERSSSRGDRSDSITQQTLRSLKKPRRLTLSFIGFYAMANIGWYLYADAGQKFVLLPRKIEQTVITLFLGNTFTGRTARRLERDYGTVSIFLSKRVYALIGLLMIVGLVTVYYRRFVAQTDTEFDDEYLAIATVLLGVFGMTILVPGWGGGRPMMITFIFTVIYAVVGVSAIAEAVRQLESRVSGRIPYETIRRGGVHAFGVVLVVFFLLNSGVVAAVVTGGAAPSNVPSQPPPDLLSKNSDAETHAWLIDHTAQNATVYGDYVANRQADWLAPEIAIRTAMIRGYGRNRANSFEELLNPGVPEGYMILHGENLNQAQFIPNGPHLSEVQRERQTGSIIYSTGKSQVYFLSPEKNEKFQSRIYSDEVILEQIYVKNFNK